MSFIKTPLIWMDNIEPITKAINNLLPTNINNYYEPFVGSGSVFCNINPQANRYFLSDHNQIFYILLNVIKNNLNDLISPIKNKLDIKEYIKLEYHIKNHSNEYHYSIYKTSYGLEPIRYISHLLYLIESSQLRSIYEYADIKNIPFRYISDQPTISFDIVNLCKMREKLHNTIISCHDFEFITPSAGDFVFLNPPAYFGQEKFCRFDDFNPNKIDSCGDVTKMLNSSKKIRYSEDPQLSVSKMFKSLTSKKVNVMLCNSDAPYIRGLYEGFKAHSVDVGANNYPMVLITNY